MRLRVAVAAGGAVLLWLFLTGRWRIDLPFGEGDGRFGGTGPKPGKEPPPPKPGPVPRPAESELSAAQNPPELLDQVDAYLDETGLLTEDEAREQLPFFQLAEGCGPGVLYYEGLRPPTPSERHYLRRLAGCDS